jgi:two-component system, LytTR family, sensor kinase
MPAVWRTRAKVAMWFAVPWTVLVVLWALQWGAEISPHGAVDWPKTFTLSALNWYSSALVSVPLTYLIWRRGLAARLYRSLLFYAFAVAAASVARFMVFVPLHNWFTGSSYEFFGELRNGFIPQFVGLITVVAVVLAIRYARLANELTTARLEALQAQLHPHFLFNTLHAVSALMRQNVDDADEMLVRLCDLLRSTLQHPQRTEIALSEELTILQQYVDIMERRFPGRLRLTIDVPPDVRETRVPPLLLQPLVENVLQHGLDESGALTDVRVSVERANGVLRLRVVDNGRGLRPGEGPRLGIGLENTRHRVETLYGRHARLTIGNGTPSGTEVLLTIPFGTPA